MTQLELPMKPHSGLTASDLRDFTESRKRIYNLMIDGQWHSASEIIEVSRQREGLRRLRELRNWFDIDKKNAGDRNYFYKLKEKE